MVVDVGQTQNGQMGSTEQWPVDPGYLVYTGDKKKLPSYIGIVS